MSWCLNTFSLYFASISLPESGTTASMRDISEERKLLVVKLLQSMLENLETSCITVLYDEKYLPVIGHVVSLLLQMVLDEKNRDIKTGALLCLRILSGCSVVNEPVCLDAAGKCWAAFLPGVCNTFNKLFTLASNVPQQVMMAAIETFGFIVHVVLNDKACAELLPAQKPLDELITSKLFDMNVNEERPSDGTDRKKLGVQRTEDWLTRTTQNVNMVFKNFFPVLMCHSKPKVRIALLTLVDLLVSSCTRTLAASLMDFLDVLVKHSCDVEESVRTEAEKIITRTSNIFHKNQLGDISCRLQERLYSELISMPRIVNSSSEDVKIAKLQLIKGYMTFYGDYLNRALHTQSLLERFISSLTSVLELEVGDVNLVEQKTSIFRQAIEFGNESYDNRFYSKNFKFFRNITVHRLLKEIIHLLGRWGDVHLIVDFLIEQAFKSTFLRNQSFIIVNEILVGMTGRNSAEILSISELVLSTYIDDQFMKLPLSNSPYVSKDEVFESDQHALSKSSYSNGKNIIPFEILNSNIQLICILLEGIANCAQLLQSDFNDHLMNTLYPLIEQVGSTNAAVSSSAVETLNTIVRCCGYQDISDLIHRNSDYLLNSITLQLRRLSVGCSAPAVLCVVLRYCDEAMIEIVLDVIENIFFILDEYGEEVAPEMLLVLKHYNMAVDSCYNNTTHSTTETRPSFKQKGKHCDITDIYNDNIALPSFVEEYCKLTKHSQGAIPEEPCDGKVDLDGDDFKTHLDEDEDLAPMQEEEPEGQKETPPHFKIVCTALKKCVVYVAARDVNIRLNALAVVVEGVRALRNRENDLLPLIHKLWPPIILRLKEVEFVLVLKALDAVCEMVTWSGDFMVKRLTQDFLPYALQFLQQKNNVIENQCTFTQVFKITKKLIVFLGEVIPHLNPARELFCDITREIMTYTKTSFQVSMQETAVETLKKFHSYKPNVLWPLVYSTRSDGNEVHTHAELDDIKFMRVNEETLTKLYNQNIYKIFMKT